MPVILASPLDQAVPQGETATFAVLVIPTNSTLSYHWVRDLTSLPNDGRFTGSATSVLTIRNLTSSDAGRYSVIVSNTLGMLISEGAALTVIQTTAPGVTFATVYSFEGTSDGANPAAPLVQATNGSFYGTANSGGAHGAGTIFRFSTDGTLTPLHAFTWAGDGATPSSGLLQAADGNFYGTASDGGAKYAGTVFRMNANGALTTLHTFTGGSDGAVPKAGLVQAADGNFYGTTWAGGSDNSGTVFRLTPNGVLTPLHSFMGIDGANPRSDLVSGSGGLYGITRNGGTNPLDGSVFKISTAGAFNTLFQFDRDVSWRPVGGLVQAADGNFYGTTLNGGVHGRGTVFRVTPEGLLTTLYSFAGDSDGEFPLAALVEGKDGYFYGTTAYGGTGFAGSGLNGQGTVFRMTPAGVLTTLHYFVAFNGATPAARLVQTANGDFYGSTMNGGAHGDGTIFRLSVPPPALTIVLSGANLLLSWPSWASDLLLQQTSDLATNNWSAVTNSPVVTNLQNQVTLAPPPSGNTFYRLTH
jgi:uncharacterized repeat protein (TIGR03803 family)